MKKLLCILFSIALFCISIIPSYAATPKISVKTVSSASVGDTITVSVNLSANSGLGGLKFAINFDASYFQYVAGSIKTTSAFDMAEYNDGVKNSIKYVGIDTSVVNSASTLISFKLKVLKTGGKISLTVNEAINGNDEEVSVSTSSATVKCSHANMKWDVIKKATCTESGEKKGTCTCGYTTTEAIQKTNHTYGKWTIEKQPTENEKGLKFAKCSVCGEKKEQAIPVITTTTTETTTETTTFVENTTESTTNEPTTAPTAPIVEKTSTAEIVVKTVAVVLGVEALGLVVFLIGKKKKRKEII